MKFCLKIQRHLSELARIPMLHEHMQVADCWQHLSTQLCSTD